MKTIVAIISTSILLCGCMTDQGVSPYDFGPSYSVLESPTSPSIAGDYLVVKVGFSGCSTLHSFSLKERSLNSQLELWLTKTTPDEPCDMYVEQEVVIAFHHDRWQGKQVVFAAPSGKRYTLTQQ